MDNYANDVHPNEDDLFVMDQFSAYIELDLILYYKEIGVDEKSITLLEDAIKTFRKEVWDGIDYSTAMDHFSAVERKITKKYHKLIESSREALRH